MKKLHLLQLITDLDPAFSETLGADVPKPLVLLYGTPLYLNAVESLMDNIYINSISFVVAKKLIDEYHLDEQLKDWYPDAQVAAIDEPMDNMILTLLSVIPKLTIGDDETILLNEYTHVFSCKSLLEYITSSSEAANGLLLYKSEDPEVYHVKYSDGTYSCVVKGKVGCDAVADAYLFKNIKAFTSAAEQMITKKVKNDEMNFANMFNYTGNVRLFYLDNYHPFKTVAQYNKALTIPRGTMLRVLSESQYFKYELVNVAGLDFSRHTAKTIEGNRRITSQYNKQTAYYEAHRDDDITAPKPLSINERGGYLEFNAEYVRGFTLTQLILKDEFDTAFDVLNKVLLRIKSDKPFEAVTKQIKKRISEMNRKGADIRSIEDEQFIATPGECHGDLTMDNIILGEDGRIYLIGFADALVECGETDAEKLLKDSYLHWSFRGLNLSNAQMDFLNKCTARIYDTFPKERLLPWLKLDVLSIYPTTKDKKAKEFLLNSMQTLGI